jgi:ketosteroid isomerase-like protein
MVAVDLRQWTQDLCRDYTAGRLDLVINRVDDNVDFVIFAPPEIVPPHSRKRGKLALVEMLLKVQAEYEYLSYRPHVLGGDADTGGAVILARLRHRTTGRIFDLLVSVFVRFREGRIVEFREFVDRVDAVDQSFGRAMLSTAAEKVVSTPPA